MGDVLTFIDKHITMEGTGHAAMTGDDVNKVTDFKFVSGKVNAGMLFGSEAGYFCQGIVAQFRRAHFMTDRFNTGV